MAARAVNDAGDTADCSIDKLTGRVTSRTVSVPVRAGPSTCPDRKVMTGCWPASRRRADRTLLSRCPLPVRKLAASISAGVPLGYLARLQRAFDTGRLRSDLVPAGIVDPLTSRELEVLEMLAAGRSNQAIAGELVVTLDTVKKHVGHVLGKLGAANRTEAVARARELSLIL